MGRNHLQSTSPQHLQHHSSSAPTSNPTTFFPSLQKPHSLTTKMHTSTLIATLFTAATLAVPTTTTTNHAVVARAANIDELNASAQALMDVKAAAGCNILKCLAALAPEYATCAAALAEEGLNPIADAACFAAALNNIANPPAGCAGC
ncbi:hypothetical protein K458DRAFT_461032 [Lentithecium fluviatile CBS 122367]|uniref:Fungal calcium binding protein domain-containing protein n=1 Tax=Lentithecium fluviatile CBS 122367 TaxID=1168545 RepID=A0A6G1INH6_9PLEO|nr:hypothetical protein K458DRAFT_461032 [Lentithecium fluviatile CBS 122367]